MSQDRRKDISHPAFAVLNVSRASGNRHLWGSPFESGGFFRFVLSRAKVHVDENGETHAAPGAIQAEWAMSAEQFVGMLTNMNTHEGTRCTLAYTREGQLAQQPAPPTEEWGQELDLVVEQADEDLRAKIATIRERAQRLTEKGLGVASVRAAGQELSALIANLTSTLEFRRAMLAEQADKLKTKLAAEVVATAETWLRDVGLTALAQAHPEMLPKMRIEEELT